MKLNLEISGARLIITTLIALVLIGIVIGATGPARSNPGHSLLQTGDEDNYFSTGDPGGIAYLTLEVKDWLEIRPGSVSAGLVIRKKDGIHGSPALLLGAKDTQAELIFYPGGPDIPAPQLEINTGGVFVNGDLSVTGDVCANEGTSSEICLGNWIVPLGVKTIVSCAVQNVDAQHANCTATCPAGYIATGGGCSADYYWWDVAESRPSISGEGWYCEINEDHGSDSSVNSPPSPIDDGTGYVVCVRVT